MQKKWINSILFLLFLFEGTVFPFLPENNFNISIFPRFVLTVIIFISIYRSKQYAFFLGLGFGLLTDLIYGDAIGVYTVGMAAISYLSGWIIRYFHPTFILFITIEFLGHLAFEFFIFGMLRLYQLISIPIAWMFTNALLPTLLVNLLFAIFIYSSSRILIENDGSDE